MNFDYDTAYKIVTTISLGWLAAKMYFQLDVKVKVMEATVNGSNALFKSQLENIVKALDEVKAELKDMRK